MSLLEVVNKETGSTVFEMASTDREPISYDFTDDLTTLETVSSAVCTFTNKKTAIAITAPLDGSPIIAGDGKSVMQWILHPPFTSSPTFYELVIIATTSTGRELSPGLELRVER